MLLIQKVWNARQGIVAESPEWVGMCADGLAADSPVPIYRDDAK